MSANFWFVRENTWMDRTKRISEYHDWGWGCGYVAMRKDHPWYGMDMNDIPVEVHYGLSYAEIWLTGDTEYYVIGFDTCHYSDTLLMWPEVEVINEAKKLLQQLNAADKI